MQLFEVVSGPWLRVDAADFGCRYGADAGIMARMTGIIAHGQGSMLAVARFGRKDGVAVETGLRMPQRQRGSPEAKGRSADRCGRKTLSIGSGAVCTRRAKFNVGPGESGMG